MPAPQDHQLRAYRPVHAIPGSVVVFLLAAYFGYDTLARGRGVSMWVALAVLALVCTVTALCWLRPVLLADPEQVVIRNPLRTVVLPWRRVADIRARYSLELVDDTGRAFPVWVAPMSARARRRERLRAHGMGGYSPQDPQGLAESMEQRLNAPRPAGRHADAVARDLAEYGELVRPRSTDPAGPVRVGWFWPGIAALVAAVAALVAGLLR